MIGVSALVLWICCNANFEYVTVGATMLFLNEIIYPSREALHERNDDFD